MNTPAAVEEHRPLLFSIAYRMLGRASEAEDAVQETFLRWSEAEQDTIENPKAWLVTVLSRHCIDRLRSAREQREAYVGPWLPEPLLTDDQDPADEAALGDSLTFAFLVVLESLSPAERAVFLLHDVFAFTFEEVAAIVDRSPAACRQLASRARQHLRERRPRYESDPATRKEVTRRFLEATAGGDLDALLELLAPDAVGLSDGGGVVSAARRPIVGADRVARFLLGLIRQQPEYLDGQPATINGDLGVVLERNGEPDTALTVDVADGKVTAVYIVRNPHKLAAMRVGDLGEPSSA